MNKEFVFGVIAMMVWGMFLVLIATFGGEHGQHAAGNAGGITAVLFVGWGIYKMATFDG
jgi:hypothetical protein